MRILPFWLLFLITACDSGVVFEKNTEIPLDAWNYRNNISYKVTINDTVTPYNLYLNTRIVTEYPYSNLFVLFITKHPDGQISKERIEATLVDNEGKPLGKGLGEIFYNRSLIRKEFTFNQLGEYTFELQQNMRIDNLPGIKNVGLRIEKSIP